MQNLVSTQLEPRGRPPGPPATPPRGWSIEQERGGEWVKIREGLTEQQAIRAGLFAGPGRARIVGPDGAGGGDRP